MSSRSDSLVEEELRLPRPPGAVRRFWARHPLLADVLVMLVCLFLGIVPLTPLSDDGLSEPVLIARNIALTGLTIVGACLLLRRRQWPEVVFAAAVVVDVGFLLMADWSGSILLLVTSYSVAVYRSTKAAWIGFAALFGGMTTTAAILVVLQVITVQDGVNGLIGTFVLTLIGTLIGANVGSRNRYLDALIDRSRQLLVERDQQAQLAAVAERARIAREMHDVVSHSLTVIVALTEGAAATADPARAKDAATAAASTARGALTEMRAMLGVLRSDDEDAPLAPAEPTDPRVTVNTAQRAGYPVTLAVAGEGAAAPAVEYAIGRIVQEGLTNAMRHAPAATRIAVRIDRGAEPITVDIDNDGVKGAPGGGGFGLKGLAERAAHVGGTVRSMRAGADRWMLHAELPRNVTEKVES